MKEVLTRFYEGSVYKDISLLDIIILIQVQSTAVPKETGGHIYIK